MTAERMNKVNYNIEFHKIADALKEKGIRPGLLLHACCAPCASACLERVRDSFDVTVFYYNPNITDANEYEKRVDEIKRLIDIYNEEGKAEHHGEISLLCGRYDSEEFYDIARGLEDSPERGPRCHRCYELRIAETAELAKERGYEYFATTLTLSPLKDEQVLNRIGYALQDRMKEKSESDNSPLWLPSDFKKEGGYQRSIELSAKYNLYRQNFCGCEFSRRERGI